MIVLSDKPKLIISKTNIIYKPKPKKLYKSTQNYSLFHLPNSSYHLYPNKKISKKIDLNLKKTQSEKLKFDVNSFSLEEMEKDFNRLQAKREITTVERELKQIMEDSTKDKSIEGKNNKRKKVKGIKRPKNAKYIFYKNFDFDFEYLK